MTSSKIPDKRKYENADKVVQDIEKVAKNSNKQITPEKVEEAKKFLKKEYEEKKIGGMHLTNSDLLDLAQTIEQDADTLDNFKKQIALQEIAWSLGEVNFSEFNNEAIIRKQDAQGNNPGEEELKTQNRRQMIINRILTKCEDFITKSNIDANLLDFFKNIIIDKSSDWQNQINGWVDELTKIGGKGTQEVLVNVDKSVEAVFIVVKEREKLIEDKDKEFDGKLEEMSKSTDGGTKDQYIAFLKGKIDWTKFRKSTEFDNAKLRKSIDDKIKSIIDDPNNKFEKWIGDERVKLVDEAKTKKLSTEIDKFLTKQNITVEDPGNPLDPDKQKKIEYKNFLETEGGKALDPIKTMTNLNKIDDINKFIDDTVDNFLKDRTFEKWKETPAGAASTLPVPAVPEGDKKYTLEESQEYLKEQRGLTKEEIAAGKGKGLKFIDKIILGEVKGEWGQWAAGLFHALRGFLLSFGYDILPDSVTDKRVLIAAGYQKDEKGVWRNDMDATAARQMEKDLEIPCGFWDYAIQEGKKLRQYTVDGFITNFDAIKEKLMKSEKGETLLKSKNNKTSNIRNKAVNNLQKLKDSFVKAKKNPEEKDRPKGDENCLIYIARCVDNQNYDPKNVANLFPPQKIEENKWSEKSNA